MHPNATQAKDLVNNITRAIVYNRVNMNAVVDTVRGACALRLQLL